MSTINCQYSQLKKSGLEQSLICSLTGKYCTKQRYCPVQRKLVNTDDWRTCAQLQKEDLTMANKRNYKKKVEETKTEVIEEIAPVEVEEKLVEEPVPTIETEEVEIKEEPKVDEEDKKVIDTKYEVILATPTYYIINKNGKNITIKEVNSYKKGDIVIL
jgi:hypothetical protein